MWKKFLLLAACLAIVSFAASATQAAAPALVDRVNEAFRAVYGKSPTPAENKYWADRVISGDKKTFDDLKGAMYFQKAQGKSIGATVTKSTAGKSSVNVSAANKTQLIKDVLPIFIRIFGNDPSNAEKAWWRKRISCNEIKNEEALIKSMNFHKAKKVRMGSPNICGQTGVAASAGIGGVLRKRIAGVSTHPAGDQVRIGIYGTNGSAIHVTADRNFQVREGQSKILATLGKDDVVQVSWSDGKYHVRGSGISFDTKNEIRLVPLDQGVMKVASYNDKSATIAGKNYNRFRGVIEIRKCDGCNELWAINELRTEYYLRGLAESSDTGPAEYIKALGVAARTYVLYHKVVNGGRNHARGYDIGKTADDQLYRGYEYEIITPRNASIFNQVKGVLVTDGEADKPVSTVYFSDSDGRTRSAKEAWGANGYHHLQKSVADPHHVANRCVGHCVGMSAQGAFGFAKKDGWSFQKILQYYYNNIKLVKAY